MKVKIQYPQIVIEEKVIEVPDGTHIDDIHSVDLIIENLDETEYSHTTGKRMIEDFYEMGVIKNEIVEEENIITQIA